MIIILLLQLIAGENRLIAVDDDHVVAAINIRRKGDLVFAAQQNGSGSGGAAKGLAGSIQNVPLALYLGGLGKSCAHLCSSS